MRIRLLIAMGVAVWALPGIAQACEPMPCFPGSLLPSGGTIPANTPALRWHVATSLTAADAKPMVTLVRDGVDVEFTISAEGDETYRVVPVEPWQEGATYTFKAKNACTYLGPKTHSSTFAIGAEAAPPKSLGRLVLPTPGKGKLEIGTSSGSCSVEEEAVWGDIEVDLSEEAKPWAAMIDFTPKVDGKRWGYESTIGVPAPRGQSEIGRGKTRVYARCQEKSHAFEGVEEGAHEVVVEGQVFGLPNTMESEPLSLSLDCTAGANVIGVTPAATATEKPSPPPASPTRDGAGAHARGCSVGGASGWPLLALLAFVRRRR